MAVKRAVSRSRVHLLRKSVKVIIVKANLLVIGIHLVLKVAGFVILVRPIPHVRVIHGFLAAELVIGHGAFAIYLARRRLAVCLRAGLNRC